MASTHEIKDLQETEDRKKAFIHQQGQTNPYPFLLDVERAEGAYIYDKSGKPYLDMIAGVAVNNIGHCHPSVIQAIQDQIEKHLHVMVYGEFIQDAQLELSARLLNLCPPDLNKVYVVNSGTEANEAAVKLAKRVTGRYEIVSMKGSYHGNSQGSMSISHNEYKKSAYRPLIPGTKFIQFNDLNSLDQITERTAGVILETIQGDAGVRIPTKEYLKAIRKKCTEVGALLIFDEIQCGIGRTGKVFAFEYFDVVPDILTLGKALGGGMPIGALVANEALMNQFAENPVLGHISTFAGHPVNCAAAAACLKVLTSEDWVQTADQKGALLEELLIQHSAVKSIRRIGLMFAIDMESADAVNKVVEECLEQGLISFWFLSHPDSFRLSPPLSISEEEIKKAANIILTALDKL